MNIAIILAGGKGKRMGSKMNKLFLLLKGEPLIFHALNTFDTNKNIHKIVLVVNPDDKKRLGSILNQNKFTKIIKIVNGGKERQDSVYNGIRALKNIREDNFIIRDDDIIIIHNAANPFIEEKIIKKTIDNAKKYGSAAVGFRTIDTIKIEENGFVLETLNRKKIWQIQTPQAMKYLIAKKAFESAYQDNFYGTDDTSLVERLNLKVRLVECDRKNFKITDRYDLALANDMIKCSKIGFGIDSHSFDKNKPLILGNLLISDKNGFKANSDGDVILHALFNALSTSIGMKSLGFYANKMCKGGIIDSKKYVEFILDKVWLKGYKIGNVAIMLEGRKPRVDNYIDEIKKNLSELLKIDSDNIGIAATTGENLSAFGKGKGMKCFVLITLKNVLK